ncbi:hypothetical protein T484DRAFT_3639969, partial [Baffinella frigidus]
TLHPAPCTLHPTPCTLHPAPYTLHPTPCTLHPAPCTLHPTPYTLHPKAVRAPTSEQPQYPPQPHPRRAGGVWQRLTDNSLRSSRGWRLACARGVRPHVHITPHTSTRPYRPYTGQRKITARFLGGRDWMAQAGSGLPRQMGSGFRARSAASCLSRGLACARGVRPHLSQKRDF